MFQDLIVRVYAYTSMHVHTVRTAYMHKLTCMQTFMYYARQSGTI